MDIILPATTGALSLGMIFLSTKSIWEDMMLIQKIKKQKILTPVLLQILADSLKKDTKNIN